MIELLRKSLRAAAIFILLMSVGVLTALADDGDVDDDGDESNTDFPCNPAVEAMLEAMDIEDGCAQFESLGVSPGEFMKAWRLSSSLESESEDALDIWQDILELKTESGYGWGQIKMAYYLGGSVEGATELLETYRSGEEKVGWGNLKKAKALVDSGLYADYDQALEDLETVGWGGIKPEGYNGPPPWAKGKGSGGDEDSLTQSSSENRGTKDRTDGPPYGKAKGRDK